MYHYYYYLPRRVHAVWCPCATGWHPNAGPPSENPGPWAEWSYLHPPSIHIINMISLTYDTSPAMYHYYYYLPRRVHAVWCPCATGWHPNAGPPSGKSRPLGISVTGPLIYLFISHRLTVFIQIQLHCTRARVWEKETRIYCAFKALIVLSYTILKFQLNNNRLYPHLPPPNVGRLHPMGKPQPSTSGQCQPSSDYVLHELRPLDLDSDDDLKGVLVLLFLLKIAYPPATVLMRGRHAGFKINTL